MRVPTDTPPGDNAPHAEATAALLEGFGFAVERHPVPDAIVREHGLTSITNLVVRRRYGEGPTIALNAHGDVVPPGEGWHHDPYGGEVEGGKLYGRAAAVSKSDFATYTFAVRALEALGAPLAGERRAALHLRRGVRRRARPWPAARARHRRARPADRRRLQLPGRHRAQRLPAARGHRARQMAHAAIPATGVDALQGAVAILNALYAQNEVYRGVNSQVAGITHPYLNVGTIEGGTNTNVVPGKVVFRLDRRMIPEEDPVAVEATLRELIAATAATRAGITVDVRRLLLARALKPLPGNAALVAALQRHGEAVFGEPIPESGTPLYTDVRLYGEAGVPAAIYGAGPAHRARVERQARRRAPRARRPAPGDEGRRPHAARAAGASGGARARA